MGLNAFAVLAKAVPVGGWLELTVPGYDAAFTRSPSAEGITTVLSYTHKIAYDPIRRRVYCVAGGGHISAPANADFYTFFVYEIDYNRVTKLPIENPASGLWGPKATTSPYYKAEGNEHGYGLMTVGYSIATGIHFFRTIGNHIYVHYWDVDVDDVNDITCAGNVAEYRAIDNTYNDTTDGGFRGNLEFFPERNELLYSATGSGNIYKKTLDSGPTGTWSAITGSPFSGFNREGHFMAYNSVLKAVVFGGGANDITSDWNKKWWMYDSTGAITALDDLSTADHDGFILGSDSGKFFADPGSGKFIAIRHSFIDNAAVEIYELDPLAGTGSQWTHRTDLEAAYPLALYNDSPTDNKVFVPIPEFNVVMAFESDKVWLYRHSAGLTFEQKAAQFGVMSSYPLRNQNELLNAWSSGGSDPLTVALNAEMASRGSGIGYDYPYSFSYDRGVGEGNNHCGIDPYSHEFAIPRINGGSLEFFIPGKGGEAFGDFNFNFDGVLHATQAAEAWIAPNSAYGRRVWVRFRWKADANFWANNYRQARFESRYTNGGEGAACTAGSDILTIPTPAVGHPEQGFTEAMEGLDIALGFGGGDIQNHTGYYTIIEFINDHSVRLNTSPCPDGDGYSIPFAVAGDIDTVGILPGGPKLIILTGNPPEYGTVSFVVTCKNHAPFLANSYFNGPSIIGTQGQDTPHTDHWNDLIEWNQDGWNDVVVFIEVGFAGDDSTGDSRFMVWVNGVKGDPETDWYTEPGGSPTWPGPIVNWGPNLGFGWGQVTPQMTHKDPNQQLLDAHIWVGEYIVSNQPIQVIGSFPEDEEEPAAPSTKRLYPSRFRRTA